jgi:capsular polysaccharide biosynthesis protein
MNQEITLGQLVRRWWWLLGLASVVGAIAGYVVAKALPKTYQSTATMLVGPVSTGSSSDLSASSSLTATYESLASSQPVLANAISTTHAGVTPLALEGDVSTTSNSISRLVTVSVSNPDPKVAAALANAVAARVATLARQSSGAIAGKVTLVNPAIPAGSAASPKKSLFVVLGGFAGLLITSILLFGRADGRRVGVDEPPQSRLEVPNLGVVDISPARGSGELLGTETPERSGRANEYRTLAARLGAAVPLPRSILVVDSTDGSAAAMVAAKLAGALVQEAAGEVLLADVNSASGGVTQLLGLQGHDGFSELLGVPDFEALNGKLSDMLVDRGERLLVLPKGGSEPRAAVSQDRVRALLKRLKSTAELVVIAGPSLSHSASGLNWVRGADSVLFVVDGNRVSEEDVSQVTSDLAVANADFLGSVVGERRVALPSTARRVVPSRA